MSTSAQQGREQWRQNSRVFQERAEEYNSWYDNSLLFTIEAKAFKHIATSLPQPRIEIGSGPGRFAEQLDVSLGIDPAPAALQHGMKRGIIGIAGVGEQLPLRPKSAGTLYLLFTLCFLAQPKSVLRQCLQVLKSDGRLVIGQVPLSSPWGQHLEQKKNQGNPYYRHARFYTAAETLRMLDETGFTLLESYSTLLQLPGSVKHTETAQPGMNEQAGFCILVAGKKEKS